jgi:hypothetical protein
MTEAVYPSIFHQDPRYFRRQTGSTLSRLGYAVEQIFWTRTDSGRMQFNFSEILGNSSSVAISNLYYPDSRSSHQRSHASQSSDRRRRGRQYPQGVFTGIEQVPLTETRRKRSCKIVNVAPAGCELVMSAQSERECSPGLGRRIRSRDSARL